MIVSAATLTIAVRCLLTRRFVWALVFLGVLGVFTPFQRGQFSEILVAVFDMAALALFAASPVILRESAQPVALSVRPGKL